MDLGPRWPLLSPLLAADPPQLLPQAGDLEHILQKEIRAPGGL